MALYLMYSYNWLLFLWSHFFLTPFPCPILPEIQNREKAFLQTPLHSRLFPMWDNNFVEVWLFHTIDGAVLYGYCLNFFNRKATPLSIKNISILPASMVVPFSKSLVSPFLLFKGMALTYLQEVISGLFIQDSSASCWKMHEWIKNSHKQN